ncbi:MAG: DUF11 domain-containing protein [Firmicutes bacterium]|nr:DUF11 domain-containing protein [Bacillota bacterium]
MQDGNSFKFVNVYNVPIVKADLTLVKTQAVDTGKGFGAATAEPQQVKAGDKVKYMLTVKNEATAGTAAGITIIDVIPEGLIFVETDGVGVEHEGTVTWNISPLDGGAERTVYFIVEVPEVTEDTTWENVATVTYEHPDDPLNPDDPDDPDEEEPSDKVIIETKGEPQPKPEPEPEEKPEDGDTPDTGDHTNITLWLMLLTACGAGMAGTVVYKRRRDDE